MVQKKRTSMPFDPIPRKETTSSHIQTQYTYDSYNCTIFPLRENFPKEQRVTPTTRDQAVHRDATHK